MGVFRQLLNSCRWLALIAALWALPPALAQEPTPLDWYRVEFAPVFILTGEDRDLGFGDVLVRTLIARLPHYRHQLVDAPLERALDKAGFGGRLACSAALLQTPERAIYLSFSNPYLTPPPNGALIRASDRLRFAPFLDSGRLSLRGLLPTGKFTVGVQRRRSYGPPIDAILAYHRGESYLIDKPGQSANSALMSDLSAQRGVDLVLAYPLEAAYWLDASRSPVPLHFLPIAEAQDHEEWRVGCSRTPAGERAIAAINALFADADFRQDFQRAYAAWQERLTDRLPGVPGPDATP